MKTIITEGNRKDSPADEVTWYFLADSALANAGKPFFIPEFADCFEAYVAPAVRFTRLGKSIGERFATRYYTEMAPALHIRAPKLRERLLREGKCPDMAHSFDRSLIVGRFIPVEEFAACFPVSLVKNGCESAVWHPGDFDPGTDRIVSLVSAANTIKTGDILLPGLSRPVEIATGDRLTVMTGSGEAFYVAVR